MSDIKLTGPSPEQIPVAMDALRGALGYMSGSFELNAPWLAELGFSDQATANAILQLLIVAWHDDLRDTQLDMRDQYRIVAGYVAMRILQANQNEQEVATAA